MTELLGFSTMDGVTQKVTLNEAIADLTYINYRYNRQNSPDVSVERWAKVYYHAKALEARYQTELSEVSTAPIVDARE